MQPGYSRFHWPETPSWPIPEGGLNGESEHVRARIRPPHLKWPQVCFTLQILSWPLGYFVALA